VRAARRGLCANADDDWQTPVPLRSFLGTPLLGSLFEPLEARRDGVASKRANEEEGKAANYRIGDLEIAPAGRQSGERPLERNKPPAPPAAPVNTNATPKRAGAPRNLTLADGDAAGPALELDFGSGPLPKLPQARTPAGAASNSNAGASVLESFGEKNALGDDFEDGFANLPALEVEKVERKPEPRASQREGAPQPGKAKLSAEAAELQEVRALAGFGDAPDGLITSVRYAVHVTRRLFTLRGERAAAQQEVQKRAHEHNAALAAMGQALMAIASQPTMEPLRSKVARVFDERAKVEKAGVDVEKAREDNQRAAAALEQEASVLREKLEPFVVREKQASEAQKRADEEVRRAQAMQRRAEIELRALNEASDSPDPRRLEALELQLTQRRGVVAALLETLDQANVVLGQARHELALQRGSLDVVEDRRKRLTAATRAREAEVEGQKRAADGALDATLRELAEAARQHKLEGLVPSSAETARQTEAALNQAGGRMVRFDRALTLYDRSAVIKGYGLLLAIAAGLIAVLVLR
jgi:hypothetical protein